MDLKLQGKLIFVSGSTLGIGLAIAKKYVELGAEVIINGRNEEKVQKCVASLRKLEQGKVHGCVADLSTAEGADKAIAFTRAIRPLDILVNNMGIFESKEFTKITDDEWFRFFNVNVMSGVRLCRAFLPDMLARNSGSIIFIASEAAVCPKEFMIHYSMTKTAQLSISRGLAELTKGTKVRVNTIMPGPTWTEGVATYIEGFAKDKGISAEEARKNYHKNTEPTSLIQRFIDPEEIANAVAFISSDLASAMNGSSYRCEGGIVKHI